MKKLTINVCLFLLLISLFSCGTDQSEKFIPTWIKSTEWYGVYENAMDYNPFSVKDNFIAKLYKDTLYYFYSGNTLDTSLIQIINFEEDSSYYYLTELFDTNLTENNKIKRYPYSCIRVKNAICLKLNYDKKIDELLDKDKETIKNAPLFSREIYLFPYNQIDNYPEDIKDFKQVKLYGYSVGDTIRDWSNIDNNYTSYCYLHAEKYHSSRVRFDLFNDSIIYEITGFDMERNGLNNIIKSIDKKYNYPQPPPIDTTYQNSKPYRREYSWNDGNVKLGEWIDDPLLKGWTLRIYDYPVQYYLNTANWINRVKAYIEDTKAQRNIIQ